MAWRTATQMVERIGGHWNWQQVPDILDNYASVFIVFLIGMIIHWLPDRFKRRYRLWFASMPVWLMACRGGRRSSSSTSSSPPTSNPSSISNSKRKV